MLRQNAILRVFPLVKFARYLIYSESRRYRQLRYRIRAKKLDEGFEPRKNRDLGEFPYSMNNTSYEKLRLADNVRNIAAFITVGIVGSDQEGKRRHLGISVELKDAEIHWREFLLDYFRQQNTLRKIISRTVEIPHSPCTVYLSLFLVPFFHEILVPRQRDAISCSIFTYQLYYKVQIVRRYVHLCISQSEIDCFYNRRICNS